MVHQAPSTVHFDTSIFNKILVALLVLAIGGIFSWYGASSRQTAALEVRVGALETKVDGMLTKDEHREFKEEVMNTLRDIKAEQLHQREMLEDHMGGKRK